MAPSEMNRTEYLTTLMRFLIEQGGITQAGIYEPAFGNGKVYGLGVDIVRSLAPSVSWHLLEYPVQAAIRGTAPVYLALPPLYFREARLGLLLTLEQETGQFTLSLSPIVPGNATWLCCDSATAHAEAHWSRELTTLSPGDCWIYYLLTPGQRYDFDVHPVLGSALPQVVSFLVHANSSASDTSRSGEATPQHITYGPLASWEMVTVFPRRDRAVRMCCGVCGGAIDHVEQEADRYCCIQCQATFLGKGIDFSAPLPERVMAYLQEQGHFPLNKA